MNWKLQLASFFFPEKCPFCRKVIGAEDIACDECLRKMLTQHRPIVKGAYGFRCISSFLYKSVVRRALIRIKFHERTQHIRQFAEILAQDIRDYYGSETFDLITFVPMHPKDMKVRGYNQSHLLAKELSRLLDIPCVEALTKIKRTEKQHRLPYKNRKTNLNGAFALTDKQSLKGKRILLIDDIVTSGETLGHCALKLNQGKPALICCATIARAGLRRDRRQPMINSVTKLESSYS